MTDEEIKQQVKILQKINDGIKELTKDRRDAAEKWKNLIKGPGYRAADEHEKAIMSLVTVWFYLGDSQAMDDMVSRALLMHPMFLDSLQLFSDTNNALKWYMSPCQQLDGNRPWVYLWKKDKVEMVLKILDTIDYENVNS